MTTLIPEGYRVAHKLRLNNLFNFTHNEISSQALPSKVIHKELKLPIKGADGELVMGYICVRMMMDI